VIELEGGGYNKVGGRIPHDLAHFVVEDALGLEAGLWGVLAAGGMFEHAKVIEGRRPPHFAKRAQAVVDAAGDRLSQAEMLTRFVCDQALDGADRDVERLKRSAGSRWWRPVSADALERACGELRRMAKRWAALRVGESIQVAWRHPAP
jgi:hypothetical protein